MSKGMKNPAKKGLRILGKNCVANPKTVDKNF